MTRAFQSIVSGMLFLCFVVPVQADDDGARTWIAAQTIPAEEAFQAAAADKDHFYAIANASIGKYSRKTSQRVAVSTGEAKHLNSGFFWNQKLYCAHSNYPSTPEESEVKVLDPESMQLSTHHRFGDHGGSLTWVVRHDDHWWCNFAFYGDENHQTYLARFDEKWNESGRWTYPSALLKQLGRYSLSGGIWFDDHLLVTGHDDAVLFKLSLPESGSELQLKATERVPFFGQGFAVDPFTDGLIGIERKTRRLILAKSVATTGLTLRVLSYNIHHGEGIDGKLDLERIASVINSVQPDLVALQEVDVSTERTKRVDQIAELGRLTRMTTAFGANIPLQGGHYGNAILSRFPMKNTNNEHLPLFDRGEQRGVLRTTIDLGAYGDLSLLATHFDHRTDDTERVASADHVNRWLVQTRPSAAILAGDINATPDSRTLERLLAHWQRTNNDPLPTIPVHNPTRQIDYVFVYPASRWRVVETRVLDEDTASDHRPILAIIELNIP